MLSSLSVEATSGFVLWTAGAGRRAIHAAVLKEVGAKGAFDGIRFDGKTDPQIVREMLSAAGHSGTDNGEMVEQIQPMSEGDRSAILDYVSRLEPPPELQAPPGWQNPDFAPRGANGDARRNAR